MSLKEDISNILKDYTTDKMLEEKFHTLVQKYCTKTIDLFVGHLEENNKQFTRYEIGKYFYYNILEMLTIKEDLCTK